MTTSDIEDQATRPRREAAFVRAVCGGEPFLAETALATGVLARQDLRTRFRRIHPKVYARRSAELTTMQSIRAAWLWGGADAVFCGGAAAFLAGE